MTTVYLSSLEKIVAIYYPLTSEKKIIELNFLNIFKILNKQQWHNIWNDVEEMYEIFVGSRQNYNFYLIDPRERKKERKKVIGEKTNMHVAFFT